MAQQTSSDVIHEPATSNREPRTRLAHPLLASEDWWAVWAGGLLLALAATGLLVTTPTVGGWTTSPGEAFAGRGPGLLALGAGLLILTALAVRSMGGALAAQAKGFVAIFALAVLSYVFAEQRGVKASGFEYAFWALALGLLISNTVGTPAWIRAAVRGEFYIKTGLVLLGAEILFGRMVELGPPGLFVAWLVTPIVVIFMYLFGTRVLRMASKSLVIVVATATSVCGVSAAIAAAAAARARREELTLTVGLSLIFTVFMMIVMPLAVRGSGMDEVVGAAWIGGTIDSTGAVVAAGAMLGERGEQVAAIVKMIQNMLIGLIAFAIAVCWVTRVEVSPDAPRPDIREVWYRFPKFILGFVGASLVFSFALVPAMGGDGVAAVLEATSDLRGWFFALAFVSIGLESNLRELAGPLKGGKPIQLYLVGQTFNLVLTLAAAYLAFGGVLFERIR